MDNDANPEFSGYLHAIARRKALLFGIAIPIALLAILLAIALPDRYTSSALVEIDEPTSAQSLAETSGGASYADQYVTNLKGIVLTDGNLRKMAKEQNLYPDMDEGDMLTRIKRDISVNIVTTPILDPRTGREREVVDAFTLSYDNRIPVKAQKGAQWLVTAFLAEHRRQRQGRASSAAGFYAQEAERIRAHVAELESKLADFKRANAGQLPELTEVNMSMMDRAESQLAQNDQQERSLATGARVPVRTARAGALSRPGCRQRAPARRTICTDARQLRRGPPGHDRVAPSDRQPESTAPAPARDLRCARSSIPSAPPWPRRASAMAPIIPTSSASIAKSRLSRRASRMASGVTWKCPTARRSACNCARRSMRLTASLRVSRRKARHCAANYRAWKGM